MSGKIEVQDSPVLSSDLIHLSDSCICSAISPIKWHSGIFQLRLTRLQSAQVRLESEYYCLKANSPSVTPLFFKTSCFCKCKWQCFSHKIFSSLYGLIHSVQFTIENLFNGNGNGKSTTNIARTLTVEVQMGRRFLSDLMHIDISNG